MVEKLFTCLHYRYIMARHADGTAQPLDSTSRPLLRRLRREGLGGLGEGLRETRKAMDFDRSLLSVLKKEFVFWPVLVIGAIEFMFVVAGFRGRIGGNWQWVRDVLEIRERLAPE